MGVNWPGNPTDGQTHSEGGQSWVYRDPPGVWRIVEFPVVTGLPDYDSGWLDAWALPYSHFHGLGEVPLRYEFLLRTRDGNNGGYAGGLVMGGVSAQDGDGARRTVSYASDTVIYRRGSFYMDNSAGSGVWSVTDADAELRILCWLDVN